MPRRLLTIVLGLLCAVTAVATPVDARAGAPAAPGGRSTPTLGAQPLPDPKASILVDLDTGAVLAGVNRHQPVGVASAIKLMSAVVAREYLDDEEKVEISSVAEGMPARKLNLKEGEKWEAGHLLRAMLLCSCNDAAVALAEGASGSLEAFSKAMTAEAEQMGMVDNPVLNDPSGLDDEFSFRGGNSISVYDLAIAARAFLADEELAEIAQLPEATFLGGDGVEHRVTNHNRLLKSYPGAIGLKTGYTKRTGYSLVGAARRDGRTMLAIVVDSPNTYQQVTELLDRGFAIPVEDQVPEEELPEAGEDGRLRPEPPPTTAADEAEGDDDEGPVAERVVRSAGPVPSSGGGGFLKTVMWVFLILAVAVFVRRRQVVMRRRRRAAARRRAAQGRGVAERDRPVPRA